MNKNLQKANPQTLMFLASLKNRETSLLKDLERVRSEMKTIQKNVHEPIPVARVMDLSISLGIEPPERPAPVARDGISHKDALIAALKNHGPMRMKELCLTAIKYGAKTSAKDPRNPLHAVLCRNKDIFFSMGSGWWGTYLTRNEIT